MSVTVGGREVALSNPGKVLFPATGFTKRMLAAYYGEVAGYMVPHLKGRALTMVRYPDGVEGEFFYEKRCPAHRPPWAATAEVPSRHGEPINACLVDDEATLLWVANLAAIELHVPLARAGTPDVPDCAVFDLDPGEGAGAAECARVALIIRDVLGRLGLACRVKTSGRKGLHVYLPINRLDATFEQTRLFTRGIATLLSTHYGELVTAKMPKEQRKGRVFVNWEQNDAAKTMACVYSLRAGAEPCVSFPLAWEEVAALSTAGGAGALKIGPKEALKMLGAKGDLFSDINSMSQLLPGI